MENASRALLMAASLLIGLLILSLAVYLFMSFGVESAEIHKQQEVDQLNQFNVQFTSYVGKEGVTIYDVVTVANLASENNTLYAVKRTEAREENQYNNYISVKLDGARIEKGYGETRDTDYYDSIIKQNMLNDQQNLTQYECEVEINPNTGRVFQVKFSKKD